MSWTIPIESKEAHSKFLSNKFYKLINPLVENKLSISYGNSILSVGYLDILRLVYEQEPESKREKIFKSFLLKTFADSEKVCPGSGPVAIASFLICMNSKIDEEETLSGLKEYSLQSKRCGLKELKEIISKISSDPEIINIAKKIIDEGGFSSSCDIDTTYDLTDRFIISEACSFKVVMEPNFSSSIKSKEFSDYSPDIIVVDGMIEEVSEIHHVLQHYFESKKTCFLVSRGYGQEVISTLAANFNRGSLKVIPGILVYNLDSINSLKDICVVSNSPIISTLKGDKISSIDTKEIASVDFAKIGDASLEIKNKSEFPRVVSLIKNLRKQIESEPVQDKIDILEKRTACLSPRKVKILLSNHDKDSVGIKKDRIKLVVSTINSACSFGIIDFSEYQENNRTLNKIVNFFKNKNISSLPARIFFEGARSGISNAEMLKSTKQIISIDS